MLHVFLSFNFCQGGSCLDIVSKMTRIIYDTSLDAVCVGMLSTSRVPNIMRLEGTTATQ